MAHFSIAFALWAISLAARIKKRIEEPVNAELCRQALAKVGNPNVLVNLVSRRVRQLNSGGGALSRSLIANADNLGAADIALLEILEEKMGWEMPERLSFVEPTLKKRKKSSS